MHFGEKIYSTNIYHLCDHFFGKQKELLGDGRHSKKSFTLSTMGRGHVGEKLAIYSSQINTIQRIFQMDLLPTSARSV